MTRRLGATVALLCAMHGTPAAQDQPRPPVPADPIAALLDAARTHDIVAVSDPHGNVQMQALLLSLIRDPRFPAVVNDIVLETASARYQDAIDRFVRGDDVPREVLRRAWEDHTVPNSIGQQAEELIRAVRDVNASRPDAAKLRVIAGDPPIDWDNVTSAQEHWRWIEQRDTYPADLIRRQVLDRRRRALVIYGQLHLQRRQIGTNYESAAWQFETVVSLLARDPVVRIFTAWTLSATNMPWPDDVAAWPAPSLAPLRGTTLGARDFGAYSEGLGSRFAVRDGKLVPLPREAWRVLPMQDQFDALLYLGPRSSLTNATMPTSLCQDRAFVETRLRRLALAAPPVEIENFRKACGL
jgi:hypothetical protein